MGRECAARSILQWYRQWPCLHLTRCERRSKYLSYSQIFSHLFPRCILSAITFSSHDLFLLSTVSFLSNALTYSERSIEGPNHGKAKATSCILGPSIKDYIGTSNVSGFIASTFSQIRFDLTCLIRQYSLIS